MSNRFYIGKKDADEYLGDGRLEEWINDRIPDPPPSGQKCECDMGMCHEDGGDSAECFRLATTSLYRIDGEHVCYTFVCRECMEANCNEEYLADCGEYPVTGGGYAVTPRHCA